MHGRLPTKGWGAAALVAATGLAAAAVAAANPGAGTNVVPARSADPSPQGEQALAVSASGTKGYPTWQESRLAPPSFARVWGTLSQDAGLFVQLVRVSPPHRGASFRLGPVRKPAGPFAADFDLQKLATEMPGLYQLTLQAVADGGELAVAERRLGLWMQAPPEGVVKAAWMSMTVSGPKVRRFKKGTQEMRATFVFSEAKAYPATGPVLAKWYAPNSRKAVVVKKSPLFNVRMEGFVRTWIRVTPALHPGTWTCELVVRGKLVKAVSAVVG